MDAAKDDDFFFLPSPAPYRLGKTSSSSRVSVFVTELGNLLTFWLYVQWLVLVTEEALLMPAVEALKSCISYSLRSVPICRRLSLVKPVFLFRASISNMLMPSAPSKGSGGMSACQFLGSTENFSQSHSCSPAGLLFLMQQWFPVNVQK